MNFIGAMTFTGVAKTITKILLILLHCKMALLLYWQHLIAAISWNLLTWYYGIPSSSSHAIIGAIAGAAIASTGFGTLNYERVYENH